MTKKDYELIARVMAVKYRDIGGSSNAMLIGSRLAEMCLWEQIREDLVLALHADNPKFQPDRFRSACHSKL